MLTVIFDFDGVIADTDKFNKNAFTQSFSKMGLQFTDAIHKKYFMGRTLREGFYSFLGTIGRIMEIDKFIAFKKEYDPHCLEDVSLYKDTYQLIMTLIGHCMLAIVTGVRRSLLQKILDHYGLNSVFSAIITAEDYQRGKPDPQSIEIMLKKFGLRPKDVVVIEDSPAGISAAKSAGLRCIAVTHTHSASELIMADIVVSRLDSKETKLFLGI